MFFFFLPVGQHGEVVDDGGVEETDVVLASKKMIKFYLS